VLHGFSGSTETVAGVANALCQEFTVLRIDLPGHGQSDAPEQIEPYTMKRCVSSLAKILDFFHIARANFFGYSMGGRAALAFGVTYPHRLRALAVLGASAGIPDDVERTKRQEEDAALAEFILREGIEAFVDRWMTHPLFETQEVLGKAFLEQARTQRLCNRPIGLANSLRGMGAGAQEPVHHTLEGISFPILFLAGVKDTKYCSIAIELAERLHNTRVELIPGAGHAAHLEQSAAVHDALLQFFRETLGPTANRLFSGTGPI